MELPQQIEVQNAPHSPSAASALNAAAGSVRAFRVDYTAMREGGIYAKTSASKAKVAALVGAREVGFDINFRDLKVKRVPQYDCIVDKIDGFGATIDHADFLLSDNK